MAVEFDLTSEWRVQGSIDEVAEILGDAERLPEWWGDVYLDVKIVTPGDENGVGREVAFHSRGRLPYTLRWTGRVAEANRPHGWVIDASGDLVGRGVWRLIQDGPEALVRYDWHVVVEKPILKLLAPILRPAFSANHRWAMERGLEGLQRELSRNRAEG